MTFRTITIVIWQKSVAATSLLLLQYTKMNKAAAKQTTTVEPREDTYGGVD